MIVYLPVAAGCAAAMLIGYACVLAVFWRDDHLDPHATQGQRHGNTWGRQALRRALAHVHGLAQAAQSSPANLPPPVPPAGDQPGPGTVAADGNAGTHPSPAFPPLPPDPFDQWIDAYLAQNGSKR